MMDELSELREFYDPDTVELMNWINSHTPRKAVFAGSMQLLAGVKLCTGRTLTNHPHYEDNSLRERTKAVYQIYAKRSPEDVHALLRSFGADYVILEDSICYERRHQRGCRLRDLLDIANGHVSLSPRPGRDSWGRGSSRNLYTLQNDDMNQVPSFTAFCGTPGSGTSVMAVGTAEGTDEGASCQIEQLCLQLICILRLCITSIF